MLDNSAIHALTLVLLLLHTITAQASKAPECHEKCLQQFHHCDHQHFCARRSALCRQKCRELYPDEHNNNNNNNDNTTVPSTWKPRQNGLPILPFGFYQYTVTADRDIALPSQEVTHGMNLVAPYASTASPNKDWFDSMLSFLDRASDIGFLVHFQLIGFEKLGNTPDILHNLTVQINTFKDHPALFGWYLADEPDGQGIALDLLQPKYDLIKKLDSAHPVSMVFCAGGASGFLTALDLIMVDIYPIPNSPARTVSNGLSQVAALGKPIMFVPQSFGGGENWARTPSIREERLMTYLGLMYGSVAIQYFVRSAPIGFPYAASAWSEIRQMAAEVLVLTSALAGEGGRVANVWNTSIDHIDAAAWYDRDGSIVVLVANIGTGKGAAGDAATFTLTLPNVSTIVTSISSMFEDGSDIPFAQNSGNVILTDHLRGMETRAYRVETTASTRTTNTSPSDDKNLVYNPSYEIAFNPAVPDGNYVGVSLNDDAPTYFADGRTSVDGRQSLRLLAPGNNTGLSLSPYTISKLNQTATGYTFSVWSKGVNGGETMAFHFNNKILTPKDGSDDGTIHVVATNKWTQTIVRMKVGEDIATACPYNCRGWLSYELATKGTVWLDVLSLTEDY